MSLDLEKTYRVVGTVRLSGQPVDWNARAICWSGADWRAPARRLLHGMGWRLRSQKLGSWLLAATDDRQRDYSPRYGWLMEMVRRLLKTSEDVEARAAGNLARRYWETLERTGQRPDFVVMAEKR